VAPSYRRWFCAKVDGGGWLADSVIYADNHLLVVAKPPTLPTQADITEDPNMFDLAKKYVAHRYNKAGDAYLGLVHRIDRPCSGVLVFARTSKAAARLSKSISERDAEKKYVCVVHGLVTKPGRCHHLLKVGGGAAGNNKTAVVGPIPEQGKQPQKGLVEAKLAYTPLHSFEFPSSAGGKGGSTVTLLEVELYTGRKHQIRAQLSHIGHPICGDVKYRASPWPPLPAAQSSSPVPVAAASAPAERYPYNGAGIALHAFSLSLPHPTTKQYLTFTAPPPAAWATHFGKTHMDSILAAIGTKEK
jgi:23S rRNA pseudouridine1911/1915/1917 synthase